MQLPPSDHQVWKILRLTVVGTIMTVLCSFLYKNGFDKKDIVLIAMTLLGLGGYDVAKMQLTKEQSQ
jgi:hypothetical protein